MDGEVVLLGPAFLEADDGRGRGGDGELVPDFEEARVPVFGEEFETPAVESDDAEGGGEGEEGLVWGVTHWVRLGNR